MLVGKIKSEEELLLNGFSAVEPRDGTVNRYKLEVFDSIDNTYILSSAQRECIIPIIIYKDGHNIVNGTVEHIIEYLNSNNFRFYYYDTSEEYDE